MSFALRVCRHCRKPVGLDDTKCSHCKKKLFSPTVFKATLAVMLLILLFTYGALAYSYVVLKKAECPVYARITSPIPTCDVVCGYCAPTIVSAEPLLTKNQNSFQNQFLVSCVCQ